MFTVHPCQLESPARQSFLAEGVRHMSGSSAAARYKQAYPGTLACILMREESTHASSKALRGRASSLKASAICQDSRQCSDISKLISEH